MDNLVRLALGSWGAGGAGEAGSAGGSGGAGSAGVRRQGVLDAASTRLGRVARPGDPAWLPTRATRERPVAYAAAPWLAGLGLLLLLVLWRREARRSRVLRYA